MSRPPFFKKPKYDTVYCPELSRKIFYKPDFYLEEFKLKDVKTIVGAGHLHDDPAEDVSIRATLDEIFADASLRIRFINLVYRSVEPEGVACLLLRKMITATELTWSDLDAYLKKLCMKNTNKCFALEERLVPDLDRLLPADFKPKTVLDVSGVVGSEDILSKRFPNAKISTRLDMNRNAPINKSTKWDLIIVSHYLHHLPRTMSKEVIELIVDLMANNGYLFVREQDIETDTDRKLSRFIHTFYNYISGNTTEEVKKESEYTDGELTTEHDSAGMVNLIPRDELPNMFPALKLVSENQPKLDTFHNPLKNYFMLFTKK